jgi:hypothetical protein
MFLLGTQSPDPSSGDTPEVFTGRAESEPPAGGPGGDVFPAGF